MNNFEEALLHIKKLEQENQILKQRLSAVEKEELKQVNTPVGLTSTRHIEAIKNESEQAMKRYTAKLRRDIKQYKEGSNGKT